MATRKKKPVRSGRGAVTALLVNLAIIIALALALAWSALQANTVLVRRADVALSDLPQVFDGATILYASDIDLCGINTAAKSAALFRQLQALSPDLLILGGDYTSPSLFEVFNGSADDNISHGRQAAARDQFFQALGRFHARLGKYATASPDDLRIPGLTDAFSAAGITPILNARTAITLDGAQLDLVGICSVETIHSAASVPYARDACVIAVAYGPAAIPKVMTTEAMDSGHWADLVLCGHTHGGQVLLFGKSVLPLSAQERTCLAGWSYESGVPILTTSGVGCEGANLRLGSRAEVWLITLRRK